MVKERDSLSEMFVLSNMQTSDQKVGARERDAWRGLYRKEACGVDTNDERSDFSWWKLRNGIAKGQQQDGRSLSRTCVWARHWESPVSLGAAIPARWERVEGSFAWGTGRGGPFDDRQSIPYTYIGQEINVWRLGRHNDTGITKYTPNTVTVCLHLQGINKV